VVCVDTMSVGFLATGFLENLLYAAWISSASISAMSQMLWFSAFATIKLSFRHRRAHQLGICFDRSSLVVGSLYQDFSFLASSLGGISCFPTGVDIGPRRTLRRVLHIICCCREIFFPMICDGRSQSRDAGQDADPASQTDRKRNDPTAWR